MNSSLVLLKIFTGVIVYIGICPTAFGQEKTDTIKVGQGNTIKIKIMPDNRKWLATNLDVNIPGSYCFGDTAQYCLQYGRLYTWESAMKGCRMLGSGWRLPTQQEWRQLASQFGGVSDSSKDGSKASFTALLQGGNSGFNAILGGNREPSGRYARLNAHGFYWTATENNAVAAMYYNFGAGGRMLHCQDDGEKQGAFSVRCICELKISDK